MQDRALLEPRHGKRLALRGRARECAIAIGIALGVGALLIARFSPQWVVFRAWSLAPEHFALAISVRRGATVVQQVADPFLSVADPLHRIAQWRLLPPLLGHWLGLPPRAVLALAPVGCALLLASVARFARARGATSPDAALVTIVAGGAAWFFTSTGWLGYYDAWVMLGLFAVAHARSRWAGVAACALVPWVDERFAIGFPLALAVRFASGAEARGRAELCRFLARELPLPALLLVCYAALRLSLAGRAGSQSLAEYARAIQVAEAPLRWLAFGVWEGLRAGWILALAAPPLAWRAGRSAGAVLLAIGMVATLVVALASNNDLSRSAALIFPVCLLGFSLARDALGRWWRPALALIAALAVALPAHHVVSDYALPIRSIGTELGRLRDPSPPFSPDAYLSEARRARESGKLADARRLASISRRLAYPGSEARKRAVAFERELRIKAP